jgi:hypothetical protein
VRLSFGPEIGQVAKGLDGLEEVIRGGAGGKLNIE